MVVTLLATTMLSTGKMTDVCREINNTSHVICVWCIT